MTKWIVTGTLAHLPPNQNPDSKVHEANMGPTWVLSAPDGPHVAPYHLKKSLLTDMGFNVDGFISESRPLAALSSQNKNT